MNCKRIIFALSIFLICSPKAFSQYEGYEWGDSIVVAKGKYNVLKVELQAENYDLAGQALSWLLENTPKLNVSLYQRASLVYEAKERLAKTDQRRQQLQDSALWVYDKRIEYFGDEANVLNFKGKVAWKYLKERPNTSEQLFALYNRIYQLNGDEVLPINTTALMFISCDEYKAKRITAVQLQQIFLNLSETLEKQASNASGSEKTIILKNADVIEKKFMSCADLTCSSVMEVFGKKFSEKPDVAKAKRLRSMLIKLKCLDEPMLVKAMICIEKSEPSAGGSMSIAKIYETDDQLDSALKYYQQAEKLSQVPSQKAEIFMAVANLYSKKGQYAQARDYATKAIGTGERLSEAYNLIGNLYFNTYGSCKTDDALEERAIFICAYEMYKNAGNTTMMERSKEQFPSKEDIFLRNLEVGDAFKVGCWINETISLQNR